MSRRALITGVTGQDGSYLSEFLLDKGYEVVGIVRRHSTLERINIDHLHNLADGTSAINLVYGDLCDASSLNRVLRDFQPHEVYNLGAQSHVRVSFEIPEYTADVDALGTIRLLEAIRDTGLTPRFYQASTSELFGKVVETPQTETTPFYPRSPYACAKAYAFHITRNYREAYDMFAVNGILFNHESPRRGPNFVTRKVTLGAARIKLGLQEKLHLGNIEARRDWGHARDFVRAMWLMLQAETPDDYVIATGKSHSIKDLLEIACSHVGLDWKDYVVTDKRHFRPSEVDTLLGDASKARRELGWVPEVSFEDMIREMVDADLEAESKRTR